MKFSLVALDETEYFRECYQKAAGKIYTVYMYNPEEETCCCEITPSYYLIPVDFFTLKPVDDNMHDGLVDATAQDDPMYVHCRSIDRIPEVSPEGLRLKYTSENDFEDEEEALDYYQIWVDGNTWKRILGLKEKLI